MTATDPRAVLAEMQARADAATEGPWLYADDGPRSILYHQRSQRDGSYVGSASLGGVSTSDADAEFIAHARTDLPAMVAALTAVLNELDHMKALSIAMHDRSNAPGTTGAEKVANGTAGHTLAQSVDRIHYAIAAEIGGDRG